MPWLSTRRVRDAHADAATIRRKGDATASVKPDEPAHGAFEPVEVDDGPEGRKVGAEVCPSFVGRLTKVIAERHPGEPNGHDAFAINLDGETAATFGKGWYGHVERAIRETLGRSRQRRVAKDEGHEVGALALGDDDIDETV